MKILVTGSLGMIGSHLVDALVLAGHEVRGIDNLSTGFGQNTNPKAPTFKCDLVTEPDVVAGIIEGFKPDVVYANAAWAHEGLSAFCPIRITQNTYTATLNTLIPSIRAGVKRFIFVSSMAVYGNQVAPFDETMPRQPADVYGLAKSSCEQAIELLSKVHGFDYTILRPHNVIGPRQSLSDPYRNVAGIFMRRVLTTQSLVIYGDGQQKRSFSDIADVIPAFVRAATEPFASRQIINIGPTQEHTINDLAAEVLAISGSFVGIEHVADRPLEVKDAWCTNDKAQQILGYTTTQTLHESLETMYAWAKHLHETTGIALPRYLDTLELTSGALPLSWKDKTL